MRYQFIAAHDCAYRIRTMCRMLHVSTSGFYGWKWRPESGRAQANRELLHRIRAIHGGAPTRYEEQAGGA